MSHYVFCKKPLYIGNQWRGDNIEEMREVCHPIIPIIILNGLLVKGEGVNFIAKEKDYVLRDDSNLFLVKNEDLPAFYIEYH